MDQVHVCLSPLYSTSYSISCSEMKLFSGGSGYRSFQRSGFGSTSIQSREGPIKSLVNNGCEAGAAHG